MDSVQDRQLHVFFFPFLARGHILPMADLAILLAKRGIKSTIVTTPANAALVDPILNRDHPVDLLLLPFPSTAETGLPTGCENTASLPHPHSLHVIKLFKAIDLLQKPLANVLRIHRPDLLISDWVYAWTTDLARSLGIPRLVYQTCGGFANAVCDLVHKHKPHLANENLMTFPFPAGNVFPHRIEMTRADLPVIFDHPYALDLFRDAEMRSDGTVLNSFYELEPWYVEYLKGTRKLWCVGPVGLGDNRESRQLMGEEMKAWLDSRLPATVIYVCFGSECNFAADQINEMAWGLEAAGYPFVWVLRTDEIALPVGFEESMDKERGFIVRGCAPQVKILSHPAVGGFVTHCGWNSILEGVSAGLPMAAWPLHSEQFLNEKLVVEVFGIGVKVLKSASNFVDRESVRKSVESLMAGEESSERRKRAKAYQAKASTAMEEGGSSYEDLSRLMEEMVINATR